MKVHFLYFIFLSLSAQIGFSQSNNLFSNKDIEAIKNNIIYLQNSGEYAQLIVECTELLSRLHDHGQEESIHILFAYNYLGPAFMDLGNRDSAMYYSDMALKLSKKGIGSADSMEDIMERGRAYSFKAELAYFGGEFLESTAFLEEQIQFYEESGLEINELMKRPLMHLGIVYSGLGLMDKSLRSYEKARAIEEAKGDDIDKAFLGTVYVNMGSCYAYMNDAQSAVSHTLRAIELYKKVPDMKNELADLYASCSTSFATLSQMDSAKAYLEKVYEYSQRYPTSVYNQSAIASKVASTLHKIGEYEKALEYTKKGLELKRDLFGPQTTSVVYDYIMYAQIFMKQDQLEKASVYLDSAQMVNTNAEGEIIEPYLGISIDTWRMVWKKQLFEEEQHIDLADDLFAYMNDRNSYVNGLKRKMAGSLSKTSTAAGFYEMSSEVCYDMLLQTGDNRWAKMAFSMAERNKSLLLYDFISQAETMGPEILGPELLAQQDSLKRQKTLLESEIERLRQESDEEVSLITSIDELEKTEQAYEEFIEQIEQDNPNFHQYKFGSGSLDLNGIQSLLKERQMVSYQQAKDALFCFVLSKDDLSVKKISWDYQDDNRVLKIRQLITENASEEQIDQHLTYFYQKLIEPIRHDLNQPNITILPEGVLSYLPFDLLKQNFDSKPLLFDYTISYDFSAYLFLHFGLANNYMSNQLLAFAPTFNEPIAKSIDPVRSSISALPGALAEVDYVGQIFTGKILKGDKATEKRFKEQVSDYGILHLATHAIVDDISPGYSRLVFDLENENSTSEEDGYLHAYEIYHMKVNASLVTLSACNTGYGKIKKGEGVMSLSRAFAYAGVPSTVMSLWPASDKSTPELMKYFYQNLKDGQAKDVALNNARKQYLSTAKGKARHPFYWGGFVMIGDNQPLVEPINWSIWLVASVIIGGVGLFLIILKKSLFA